MVYSTSSNRYDACYYELRVPQIKYKSGSTYIVFSKIDPNVLIGLSSGDSHTDRDAYAIIGNKGSPVVGTKYKVAIAKALIVTASIKKEGATDTSYQFEYWVEGAETGAVEKVQSWLGGLGGLKYLVFACLACCAVLVLCCVGVGVKRCCHRGTSFDKVGPADFEMSAVNIKADEAGAKQRTAGQSAGDL